MSDYTETLVDEVWGWRLAQYPDNDPPASERHVVFPHGRLHVQKPPEPGYLGFTECGRMIPADALIGDEIPERFRPALCASCAGLLAKGQAS